MDTQEYYKSFIGKLCYDMDHKDKLFMIYDIYWKLNHKGGAFLTYKYINLHSGRRGEAPCSHFFGASNCVRFLSASEV